MKKLPKKNKQWAEEAYEALLKAFTLFNEEYSNPTDEDKFELISYAPLFAAMNRGIKGGDKLNHANEFVLDNLKADFDLKEPDEPVRHSICFLLAYLDTQVSFGYISEMKSDEIMEFLSQNYEISIPA
jgi:hypothetical protein